MVKTLVMSRTSNLLQYFLFLITIGFSSLLNSSIASTLAISCPESDKCGNIKIPFPFGTKEGCYRPGFDLTCNTSFTPPQLFLSSNPASNVQLLDIDLTIGEAIALNLIGFRCFNQSDIIDNQANTYMNLDSRVYRFSAIRNKFTVIGCYALGYIVGAAKTGYESGCLSFCNSLNVTERGSSCNGLGCCQTSIPYGLDYYKVQWGYSKNEAWSFNKCIYAALMEENWYKFNVNDLNGRDFLTRNKKWVPFVLDWAIRDNGMCSDSGVEKNISNPACLSKHSNCYNTTNGEGYLCQCGTGYEGNPYIRDGCQDINECKSPTIFKCFGNCSNTNGSYDCQCPKGTKGDGKITCTKIPELFSYQARIAIVSVLSVAILVAVCFLVDAYRRKKKYNKEIEEHLKYYEMMSSSLRVFTENEIKLATNDFVESQVLGVGGQGKVYKGILENNILVAIKKSKEVQEHKREEFVREIVLLSQINHKNVVGILGCCLETKIPMLVYEFVSGGSLFDLLHKKTNRFISLATRIKIALGSAEALDYIHNSISRSILHGDVKSANILLTEKNDARVSDFGASILVPINGDEGARLVQWTPGYIDQESWSTETITQCSDVYSFGVVLLEIITRKKAIYAGEANEKNSLVTCFVSMANKSKIDEMLDKDILNGDEKVFKVLREISELALWCLSGTGDDRPTMRQVVEKLMSLQRSNRGLLEQTDLEDAESSLDESLSNATPTTSTFYSTEYYRSVLDTQVGIPR